MKKLIAIEWMKLRRLNTMRVILAVYAVAVPVIYYLLSYVAIPLAGTGIEFTFPSSIYEFPQNYQVVAYLSSFFNLMIGVIIIVFTTNELKYKTQRQNIIDGLNKREVIFAKFLVIALLALVITLYTFIVALVCGLLIVGSTEGIFLGLDQTGAYFICTLGYFVFAFFFANLVRLPALAIVLYLFSTTIEGILGFLAIQEYVQFFPLTTFKVLVPFPDIFPSEMTEENGTLLWEQGKRVLLALGYITILLTMSYQVIKRRDV